MTEEKVKTIVISSGDKHRELVEITTGKKGKKTSETYHQTKIGGEWVNNRDIRR